MAMSTIPIVSSQQLEQYFLEYKQPNQQVSLVLNELQTDGFVEGKAREVGKSKVWRLTKLGRQLMEVETRPVSLTHHNVNHALKVGDIYFHLEKSEKLHCFKPEIRVPFTNFVGEERTYCPDAFFVYDDVPYLLEVQHSSLSKTSWKYKWEVAEQLKQAQAWERSEYTRYYTSDTSRFPTIVVLSPQQPNTVYQSDTLDIYHCSHIYEMFPELAEAREREQVVIEFDSLRKKDVVHLLNVLDTDLKKSKKTYQNLALGEEMEHVPSFTLEAVRKYQQLMKYIKK